MNCEYYPDEKSVLEATCHDEPLLVLISYSGDKLLVSPIDEAFEHIILLRKLDHDDNTIDQYFRIVVNQESADWTFVCPPGYKNIPDKTRRIETFYNDGITQINRALKILGYDVPIDIPKRFRRHFNMLQ